MEPKQIVAAGYDRLAGAYDDRARRVRRRERKRYTAVLLESLPAGAALE